MTNSDNTLRTFDFAGLELRVIMQMAEPWFFAGDVCKYLYGPESIARRGTTMYTRNLVEDEVLRTSFGDALPQSVWGSLKHVGASTRLTLISESGLYKLIMRSDKPEAVKFQDWVTRDVLPAIRKTGGYLLNEEARDTASADDRQAMPLPELVAYEASLSA